MKQFYLYGKVKRQTSLVRILASKQPIYNLDQVPDQAVIYSPHTLLEPQEYYKIEKFCHTSFASDFIKSEVNSVNYNQIHSQDLSQLSYVCSVQDNFFFFQAISPSYFIQKKWFSISDLVLEQQKPIITINEYADVIYCNLTDILYFKKLPTANSIFKGLDQLYRQATTKETQEFLENDFLKPIDNFTPDSVSIPNRKRIALVQEVLKGYTAKDKKLIYNYTQQYGQVDFIDGQFQIQTDNDLKHVLYGIEQRYYTTPIGNEKRIANSVITL